MKKITLKILIIAFLIIHIGTACFASSEIKLDDIGMKITISEEFYDIIQGLKNNDERVKKFQDSKESLENSGVVLDAVNATDESVTKEIIVVKTTNTTTKQIIDIRNLDEKTLEEFSEGFFESLKEQSKGVEFLETKIIKTNNEIPYLTVVTQMQSQTSKIQSTTYYTIANGNLIQIGIRYLNTEFDKQEAQNIIETINFEKIEIEQNYEGTTKIETLIIYIIVAIGIFIVCFREIKRLKDNKIEPIDDTKLKKYKKFGGFLSLYMIILIYNVITRIIEIYMSQYLMDNVVKVSTIIISVICIVLLILIIIKMLKRKQENTKKIRNLIFIYSATIILGVIFRMIYYYLNQNRYLMQSYYLEEALSIVSMIMFTMIWTTYFRVSKRVNTYYSEE